MAYFMAWIFKNSSSFQAVVTGYNHDPVVYALAYFYKPGACSDVT